MILEMGSLTIALQTPTSGRHVPCACILDCRLMSVLYLLPVNLCWLHAKFIDGVVIRIHNTVFTQHAACLTGLQSAGPDSMHSCIFALVY